MHRCGLISFVCIDYSTNQPGCRHAMQADYDLLRKAREEGHGSRYRFSTRAEMNNAQVKLPNSRLSLKIHMYEY